MSHQQETTKIISCYNELSLHHRDIKEDRKSGNITYLLKNCAAL